MKLELTKPKGYDEVSQLIDTQEWSVGDMTYLVVMSLDLVLKSVNPETKKDLLKLIVGRYYINIGDK